MSLPAKWQVPAGVTLTWKQWNDDFLVFNPHTGDTHLLDFVAAAGVQCFEQEALDEEALRDRLASRLEVEPDPELSTYAAQLITHLDHLGLIEAETA
ncbi:MAG: HPr-rel-A system PqqD family peptide chaperone [Planctomycetales bacterium]|nr:HPr-rel-A system PqqD family peptide chaperone [Planctomycetales bacterium]